MPSSFSSFSDGDIIHASHVIEIHEPIQNLERGAAFFAGTSAGSSTAYTASIVPAPDNPYSDGMIVNVKIDEENTAGSPDVTLSLNGQTAKPIVKNGGDSLEAGDLKANQIVSLIFDEAADAFQLLSVTASGGGGGYQMLFTGTRADGNVTVSSNTTLTRDMNYDVLTVQTGVELKTDGYVVRARKIVLQGSGRLDNSGNSGGAVNIWDPGAALVSHSLGGSAVGATGVNIIGPTGNGMAGQAGGSLTRGAGGVGGSAGVGGSGPSGTSGGAAGTAGLITNKYFCGSLCPEAIERGDTIVLGGTSGATGGGGAPDGTNQWSGGTSGGSGSGGGVMVILCDELDVSSATAGCIRARGGAAASGSNTWSSLNAGGAGGSGGGGGGYIHGFFGKVTGTLGNALDCDGGAGSAGTNGHGTGVGGYGGGGGSGGNIDVFRADTSTWISVRGSSGSSGSAPSGTTGGAAGAAGTCKANL